MSKLLADTISGLLLKKSPQLSQDIKAFRTMITMMSHIHRLNEPKPGPPSPTGSLAEQAELKIVGTLATILVMEHDVVAVAAKHDDRGNIKVYACAHDDPPTNEICAMPPDAQGIFNYFKSFVVTANPRQANKSEFKTDCPMIVDPEDNAPNIGTGNLEELEKLAREDW
jgi:hypothetical protein